jgi:seryl-tRNA synthetase
MLDIKFIRENPEIVKNACRVKGFDDHTDTILKLDARVRELKTITQTKTAEKNKITREIPTAADKAPLVAASKKISDEIANDMAELSASESELNDLLMRVPQIPDASAPVGPDDKSNVVRTTRGDIKQYDFAPRPHWEIMDMNGWWMNDKVAEISGSRVYHLMGAAAELDYAIQTHVMNKLIARGFTFMRVSAITKPQTIMNAGHFQGTDFSVMDNDVFMIDSNESRTTNHESRRCLAGTSEIVMNSLHADEIIPENSLPIKYFGLSSCFRREAGAAGRDTRGLYRIHEFHKVDQYGFCRPDQSDEMSEFLLNNLRDVIADLELPQRTLDLSTGDMGFNKMKSSDVEVWMPGQDRWGEAGSCSAIGEFQSRRTNTRFRENATSDVKFCATLNNTAIALPRALAFVIENHQNADGSVNIPTALQPLMGGRKVIANTD